MKIFDKLFNKTDNARSSNLTTISRTEVIDGFSIPGIIFNLQYHFTDLQVYRDGLIYCWEMVDLNLFKEKLNNNWVVTSIPDMKHISIFSLGNWQIDNGEWLYNKQTFYNYIDSLVTELNPKRENLFDCKGRTTDLIGKVQVSRFSSPNPLSFYISKQHEVFPERTNGKRFTVFFREEDERVYLTDISIFKNGHVEITQLPSKREFQFSDLQKLIKNSRLISNVPLGERVTIHGLGSFNILSGRGIDIKNKYDEFVDFYNSLQGEEKRLDKCRRIFDEYLRNPTKKLRNDLKTAYEAVPDHQKIFVGDMDIKDIQVRMIIYGEQEIEHWSQYIISKEGGYELPKIHIPKPIDE
jgi:hypothetical protein